MIAAGFPVNTKQELLYDGVGQKIKIGAKHIYQPDEHALFYGSRSIADIVRQLAIEGSNVDSIRLITNVNDLAFLAGQQSVIHAFGLREQTQTYFLQSLEQNHHQVIGIGEKNDQIELALDDSYFIAVLGSVKGELGHSLYEAVTGLNSDQDQPIFDSTLEYNINQALVQAVSTGVINKVVTLSKGGLAIALLGLYLKLNCEYGIKIHISRKLKQEELLFGESFGSALVIIGEKDLMEFQRICMLHGIPSSTIGRLQQKNEISVNNILTIPEKLLKTLPE
jgi:phosphoribosylformylglycinamidine (FGAM) synthase-like enzyme